MTEHTGLPWFVEKPEDELLLMRRNPELPNVVWSDPKTKIFTDAPDKITGTFHVVAEVDNEANAEYIVTACNVYPKLVEALARIANFYVLSDGSMGGEAVNIAKEALAKGSG